MPDLFISYSRKDKPFVQHLYNTICVDKRDTWVDFEDIPLTADWRQEIYRGIEGSHNFVLVISPDSAASEVVGEEIVYAVRHNKRLVPILYRDLSKDDLDKLHPLIRATNWIYIREDDGFEAAVIRLEEALDTDLEYIRWHTEFLERAVEWRNNNRNSSYLLRGDYLDRAKQWMQNGADHAPAPTPIHMEYIMESSRAMSIRRRIIGVSVIYGVVAALLTVTAVYQASIATHERQQADNSRQTAEAAILTVTADHGRVMESIATGTAQHQEFLNQLATVQAQLDQLVTPASSD